MKKGDQAFFDVVAIVNGTFGKETRGPVKVMGVIDNYAMVRFPRAMPFVKALGDLRATAERGAA